MTEDRAAVQAFAGRVVHALAHTPYTAPNGADLGGFDKGGRAFVLLTTEKEQNSASGEKVHVNTMLILVESDGYWIVMAEAVDDAAKEKMQAGAVDVSTRR